MYKFSPILKQTLWGGDKICRMKGIPCTEQHIGESWELSAVEGCVSVVAEGKDAGMRLDNLIEKYGAALMGSRNLERFGTRFPLLVKLIDAAQDLSLQVHPNDEQARRIGHTCGKTEMWYMISAEQGAHLYAGFNQNVTQEEYRRLVAENRIMNVVSRHDVQPGDCFFLPAGRIHSIGAGCMLVEIQQTSDLTYRIYDFDRKDARGKKRELHTEEALRCMDFSVYKQYKTQYCAEKNRTVPLVDESVLRVDLTDVQGECLLDWKDEDTFHILVCAEGSGTVQEGSEAPLVIRQGDTLLVAATSQQVWIQGQCKILTACVV